MTNNKSWLASWVLGSTLVIREAYPNVEPAIWAIASRLLFSIAPMKNEEIQNAK